MSKEPLFWNGDPSSFSGPLVPSTSLGTRAIALQLPPEVRSMMAEAQRGVTVTGDVQQILGQLGVSFAEFERGITSATAGLPIYENLESEAANLVPLMTPFRNMLPRVQGSGTAAAWRQLTQVGSDQRIFFAEDGSPASDNSVYVPKSAGYKLLGVKGFVTGFAMAAGANFQNQLAAEKTNQVRNLMKKEEKALINADASSVVSPWGDGVSALAFNGLKVSVSTANGTPAAQVQASVGALTTAHIDNQLKRLTDAEGQDPYILTSSQEILSLVHLATAEGSIIRVAAASNGEGVMGFKVTGYVNPLTGQLVPVLYSPEVAAGEMYFGCKSLPDGSPGAVVDVLPQVQLPELAPNVSIQGYVAQEIAPASASPQKYEFIVTVFEVFKLRSALHFAKSTGLTAV